MSAPTRPQTLILGLLGAAVGGALGYFAFFWVARQGFYALVLPPALLGFGASLCAGQRSLPLAAICGIAGLGLGLFTEYRFASFAADPSFFYFVTHVSDLKPITLIMLALGALTSFSLALRRESKPNPA